MCRSYASECIATRHGSCSLQGAHRIRRNLVEHVEEYAKDAGTVYPKDAGIVSRIPV